MRYLILLFILFGCKKETVNDLPIEEPMARTTQSQTSFYYTGLGANSVNGNQGISVFADVKKLQGGNYDLKSWWIAFFFRDTSGVLKWTQWGYGLSSYFGNVTIETVWNLETGQQIFPPQTYLNSPAFVFGQKTKFSIYNVASTTKWRYARNDIDVYEIDLGATSILSMEMKIESHSTSPNLKWPLINVQNISSLKNGEWVLVPNASSSGSSYASTGLLVWPVEGKAQNLLLGVAEVNMGGNGSTIAPGVILWQ